MQDSVYSFVHNECCFPLTDWEKMPTIQGMIVTTFYKTLRYFQSFLSNFLFTTIYTSLVLGGEVVSKSLIGSWTFSPLALPALPELPSNWYQSLG
ncbi:transmembrane protein, putative [Medicago truncatula]|uniref:Transmembrane protein, putative n=1 Tax=Medicago truncatula TaxID=3880 RepID=A0A072UN41_MEDTR|nr:transmembrane protein, putative [Medicago truncatula]